MRYGNLWGRLVAAASVLLISPVLGVAPFAHAAPMTIDSFSKPDPYGFFFITGPYGGDWDQDGTDDYANPTVLQNSDPGILGGERDFSCMVFGDLSLLSANGVIGDVASGPDDDGYLQIGTFGKSPSKVTLQYDGVDGGAAPPMSDVLGLGGGSLADGANCFSLDFRYVDGGDAPTMKLTVKVVGDGGSETKSFDIAENKDPFQKKIFFADFTTPGLFSAVKSLTFTFNDPLVPNVDFALDAIRTVPEPSTLVLAGLGLSVLGMVGWRPLAPIVTDAGRLRHWFQRCLIV